MSELALVVPTPAGQAGKMGDAAALAAARDCCLAGYKAQSQMVANQLEPLIAGEH